MLLPQKVTFHYCELPLTPYIRSSKVPSLPFVNMTTLKEGLWVAMT